MDFENKLIEHIRTICDTNKYILINASVHGHKNKQNIKVVADTVEGITLEQCQNLSREISDIIFRKDLIFGNYNLEVTSPGVDKPLQQDYEFIRNIGKNLKVEYLNEESKSVELVGELKNYENNLLHLYTGKEIQVIDKKKIKKAKIKLKW